jgi:CheY-like chemotaxis protein
MAESGARFNARVLLVEDELLVGMDLAQALEDWGYQVLGPFGSCAEALGAVEPDAPDVALLDLNLGPAGSSLPVAERLAQEGRPFLFLTGYEGCDAPVGNHGDAPCVSKPVSLPALREAVSRLLRNERCP